MSGLLTGWTSEHTLRLSWSETPDRFPLRASAWANAFRAQHAWCIDAVPGAQTLTLFVDPRRVAPERAEREARRLIEAYEPEIDHAPRRHVIPVCYEEPFAPDLGAVAAGAGITDEQAIERHTAGTYTVALTGFAPGFAYLDGLDTALHCERHERPRARVEAGSVGIGGAHTGVYPHTGPGGWRIIGRTPVALFDADQDPPARLALGDEVRFERIDRGAFDAMTGARR